MLWLGDRNFENPMTLAYPQIQFRTRITRTIALPIVLLLFLSGISLWQIARLLAALRWVDHTTQVIAQVNVTQKLLLDRETGLRGYLLTGEQSFLQPYNQANATLEPSLNRLRALVSDNPEQVQRVDKLIRQSQRWQEQSLPTVLQRQEGDVQSLSELERRKQSMDQMRQQIAQMIATEERLRNQRSRAAQQTTKAVIGTTVLVAIAIGAVIAYYLRRQILQVSSTYEDALTTARVRANEAQQSAAALRQLNTTLEQRVTERTAQLEEINQELEAFTYSISHDLRAPLRTMRGFATALLEDCGDLNDPCRGYIDSIIDDASHMNELINDLLSYSHLTRTQIQLQPVALEEIISEALGRLATEINESRAEIRVKTLLPQVMAHRAVLLQVVSNLLTNALKFTKLNTHPEIDISATVERQDHQEWIRLWIVDNGIGIATEHQERIFHVFERLHGVESFPGTGIGLAIVRKGLERMGGRSGVESAPGQGSRFWIALQAAVILSDSDHDSNSNSPD